MSTNKITSDREQQTTARHRPPTGVMFHLGAGAVLVLIMVFIALYVVLA